MGHREQLLEGAKRCIMERGYAHTTARHIVAASGANLASIGYHFGSKEALLREALIEMTQDWVDLWRVAVPTHAADPLEGFEKTWAQVVESFAENRPLLAANFEALTCAEHAPDLRERLSDALESAAAPDGLANLLGVEGALDEESARAVGRLYLTLLQGLMAQWLISPDLVSVTDLTDGLRVLLRQPPIHRRGGHPRPEREVLGTASSANNG
ncbi:TetR/AcrR family transcriptional regulator [Bailinhaonella thermotolerans]|uniref:TetR/AcrR family transcriptional regulator n=1 Tax=Bailinhaonella thermotolerans TaxID=1070861 RepID=UPI00192A42F7|nr:TetR/AcrR family transcriptional regulator [Bailinhaonella thermotolerans]